MSILDWIGIQGVRMMTFGVGGLALLLAASGWYTIVGAALALIGSGYALLCPPGRLRKAAFSLNAFAFAVAALIYVPLFL